ncbi:ankyrin repeat domain-containing protein [Streptomyces carpaticus]|uniref:ankyrin repeat domain-containing protein n=1 Tax=Streptomyces TaxID=1883 RepID=UPI0015922AA7|nr:ankyrin repeat domain-containing protein [Streptomyces harbinensis]QKV68836.1 ankyrin repeat domain-containing protein [Streptomyces harbinensis]UWM49493.1 ankyrin repeat domain-containing protein [Streptomyces carpaticus]
MNNRRAKKLSAALVGAARFGTAADAARLLRRGADAGRPDAAGTRPLYAASVRGAARTVAVLLAAGADPDAESGHGDEGTPLCGAACWGHTEAVRVLLAGGADPALREDGGTGHTPVEWAEAGGHEAAAELLRVALRERSASAGDGAAGV